MKATKPSFSLSVCLLLLLGAAATSLASAQTSATPNSQGSPNPGPAAPAAPLPPAAPAQSENPAAPGTTSDQAPASKTLGEIVVAATRTPQQKDQTAASVSTYSAEDIEEQNISSPQDLTEDDVGVSASRSVGGGGMTLRTATGVEDYNIRGLDENRVLLLEDGIQAPDIFSFQGNVADGRDFYDFDSLKSVEIVKSAASALYGGGAIGGVVSYTTKDPADYLAQTNNPYYAGFKEAYDSSDDSFAETATIAARSGPLDYLFLYTRRDGEQQEISASTATDGPAGANPLNDHENNFLGKVVYHLTEQSQLRLTLEYFNYAGDSDLLSATYPIPAFGGLAMASSMTTDDVSDRERVSLDYQFTGRPNLDAFKNVQLQVYYQATDEKQDSTEGQNFNPDFVGPFSPDPDFIYREEYYKTGILGANFQATQDLDASGVAQELTYGADVSFSTQRRNLNGIAVDTLTQATVLTDGTETFPRDEIPPTDTTRVGAFVQDQIKPQAASWLTLTPAVRYDYYDLTVQNPANYLTASNGVPAVPYSESSVTPSLSALAQVTKALGIYGNFAEGFRNPNTEDLNATFTNPGSFYEVIPNPKLKSEQSYDFEVGLHANYEPVKFSLAAFYNIYHDFINDQAQSSLTDPAHPGFLVFQSQNIPRAEIHGLEGSVELPLGVYNSSLEGLKVKTLFALTEGNDQTDDDPLPAIDPFKIVNTLSYDAPHKQWGAALVGTWVDKQNRIPAGQTTFIPPAYYTLDLVGRYHLTKNVLLTLGIYNLTNQTYWLYQTMAAPEVASTFDSGGIARYSMPGINVRAGVAFHF